MARIPRRNLFFLVIGGFLGFFVSRTSIYTRKGVEIYLELEIR